MNNVTRKEHFNDKQDWEMYLTNLGTIERHVQFYKGDAIAIGWESGYAPRGTYEEASRLTGDSIATLQQYVYTARAIESRLRKRELGWSIHKEVKSLEEPRQIFYLDKAVDEHLTARQLRHLIRTEGNTENEAIADLPNDTYKVIYADPPWSYGNSQPSYHTDPTNYYNTMPLQDICDIPVKDITQDNAVLFLWVTSPLLRESFDVIDAWGFTYKTSFVWDKVKHNMGHYNSVRHEFLLVCTKGSCTPEFIKLFDSVQTIERNGKHSEKPEQFRTIIDTIYPNGKRIELFARTKVEGWRAYGNEL